MKTTKMSTILVVALGLTMCWAGVSEAAPTGTAFTYQGRLIDANGPADDLYDFEFRLFDDPNVIDGNQVGSTVDINDLDVINGYFTVELDFGPDIFTGSARWLETTVAQSDGSDPCTLSPRQEITPTPYALHTRWFLVDEGLNNIFAGKGAGASNTTGNRNSAMGNSALGSNTTGADNSAMGYAALSSNTAGNDNSAMGNFALLSNTTGRDNSAMGAYALYFNTTGNYNSAVGGQALLANTTGSNNSAMGFEALYSNTTGWYNSAMGREALYSNTTGNNNSAMGREALRSNTTGSFNSAMGYRALWSNTASYNTAMGNSALRANTTGTENSAMGDRALYSNTTGQYNSAMGFQALNLNTTGSRNSAMGRDALRSNTTGNYNSAMGLSALWSNTTGYRNSAVGNYALYFNTEGYDNSAMGYQALYNNTLGEFNSAMGNYALSYNTTGYENSAVGYKALRANTTGYKNSAMGNYALWANSTGLRNSAMGYDAGALNRTGSGNVFLGYQAGYYEKGSDKLYIDNTLTGTPLIYGNFATNRVGINRVPTANTFEVGGNASKTTPGSWLANSDERIKADIQTVSNALETLDKVRLVSFKYTDDYQAKHPSIEKRRYLNIIAQEFRQVFPEYVKSSGEKLTNGEEILQVDSYPLTIYSAAAVQELYTMVKTKDAEITVLKKHNENLDARLEKIELFLANLAQQQKGD